MIDSTKIVLGTAQFGMDYGIANLHGRVEKKEVFRILELAWESGITFFDTAPSYEAEALLGEFISINCLQDQAKVITKIPPLREEVNYQEFITRSAALSIKQLGCPIEALLFHDARDSSLLLSEPEYFGRLIRQHPISYLGASVYEPEEAEGLENCGIELAFEFPFNILDRRFEHVQMPLGRRFARSIFMQGLLASPNKLRRGAPRELFNLRGQYFNFLAEHDLDPVEAAVSFVFHSDSVDQFLVGVDSQAQLQKIIDLKTITIQNLKILRKLTIAASQRWFDPRQWN